MKGTAKPPVDKLLRGISTDYVETVRDAWREILLHGDSAIPVIRAKLASDAWKDNPRGPLARYLGVLLCILDELSADAFAQEIARLQNSRLHPLHSKTIKVLSQRLSDKPVTFVASEIPVFVSSAIKNQSQISSNLNRWSKTKGVSLDGVTRIDVIARHPQLDYLGLYNIFFSGIVLTWPAEEPRGLRLWYTRLRAEFTFYHEVGHHVLGHVEGGQIREQEDEANNYAREMLRKSRPVLITLARLLFWPLKPLVSRTSKRRANNERTF